MATSDNHSGSGTTTHHHITHHHHHHHHIRRHRVPSGSEELEDEELDPRIQVELEKLNRASEEINRLELELDDARAAFRQVLSDSTQRLNGLAKKLGACVDKARPYYDARMRLKEAHLESQKAALRFERACSMHEAAKEMVQLAEEGYKRRELDLDPTWQEMLNHATMKVNDAERERIESEDFHQKTTLNFKHKDEEVQRLQKDLKRAITKSKPYFEMKAKFNQVMEDHKRAVSRLEEDVGSSKALYSQALRSLEAISDDIHRQRLERRQKLQLGVRGAGVGAEAPSPPPSWEKGVNIDGSASSNVFDSDADDDPIITSRVSHGSSDTILDIHQFKQSRNKGIICYEPAFRKKASLTESLITCGNFKTDPLDVVVFKTSTQDLRASSKYSPELSQSTVPCSHHDQDRSSKHRVAREPSQEEVRDIHGWPRTNILEGPEEESGDNVVTPTPDNNFELLGSRSTLGVEVILRGNELHLSESPRTDLSLSESSRRRDIELSQSSLSRAQEWVNKSPIPQQRRFVKSKSLIDASTSSLSISSPPESELSSSLTMDVMMGKIMKEGNKRQCLAQSGNASLPSTKARHLSISHTENVTETFPRKHYDIAVRSVDEKSQMTGTLTPHLTTLQKSIRSSEREAAPGQQSPLSGSPTSSRKSPKLQGLILRVDATGISSSSGQPAAQQSRNVYTSASHHAGQNPKVVISTQHPKLGGAFIEKPSQPQSATSVTNSVGQTASSSLPLSSLPTSAKPPASLIAQQFNRMMNVTKVSQYNSKTAPSTLSTSYHLPASSPLKSPHGHLPTSPTRIPLSPIPPSTTASLRHQLTSPTPSSPSADRYSLSGRSDSVTSGSHKSAFLKPPSDSSDTESIASTGPMLDDDQVELINMDFTEQSINPESQEDSDYLLVHSDLGPISRGHWSRMSLPPRLSCLEDFLERARLYSGDQGILVDSDDKYSNDNVNKNGNDSARSSVAASGDLDDNADDFKDENYDDEEVNKDSDNFECVNYTISDMTLCEKLNRAQMNVTQDDSSDVAVNIEIHLEDVDSASQEDACAGFEIVEGIIGESEGSDEVTEVKGTYLENCGLQANTADVSCTEVTVVISPDKKVEIADDA